jgi:hypothetical protein
MRRVSGWVLFALLVTAAEPESLSLVKQGMKARETGALEESLTLFERAYALDPNPAILNNIGVVLDELGRYSDAHAAFSKVVAAKNASEELRELCRDRADSLEPRTHAAYVRFDSAIDGELHLPKRTIDPHARETQVQPGATWIALSGVVDKTIVFLQADFVLGRRTTITWPTDQVALHTRILLEPHAKRVRIGALDIPLHEDILGLLVPEDAHVSIAAGVFYETPAHEPPAIAVVPAQPVEEENVAVPVTLFAAGAAMLVTAGVLYASASSDVSLIEDDMAMDGVVNNSRWTDARARDASAKRKGHFAVAFSLGGLVALCTGSALLIF